jgi:hypothetical protein
MRRMNRLMQKRDLGLVQGASRIIIVMMRRKRVNIMGKELCSGTLSMRWLKELDILS